MASSGEKSSDCSTKSIDFRAIDDAWYTVELFLLKNKETLIVRYLGFSEEHDDKFEAADFKSLEAIHEFQQLFRPSVVQMQDSECSMLSPKMVVCVAYDYGEDTIKFYDAIIESVIRKDHTFNEGEEECTCSFVISWLHGPMAKCMLSTNIACICAIQPKIAQQIHPNLAAFLSISRQKFELSSTLPKNIAKVEFILHDSKDECSLKDGDVIDLESNEQDIDLGGGNLNTRIRKGNDKCYFILIENLENDLASKVIVSFIYKHLSISSQAYVFPSLFWETYTTGIIIMDSQEKLNKLLDFLLNPDHLIISSRGRPWVITEEKSKDGIFGNSISKSENQSYPTKFVEIGSRITIVKRGTKEFENGKKLTKLYMEFSSHLQRLHKRLALEGAKIL